MARTANERLFDETVRRKVALLRLERGEADRVEALLREMERDLLDQIGGRLAGGYTSERLEALLVSVKDLLESRLGQAVDLITETMAELAAEEAAWEVSAIERVSPVQISLAAVSLDQVRALAGDAVQGLSIARWFEGINAQTAQRVERQLRLGIAEGETLDQLVRRIRGTRANAFKDGVLEATRRDAEAITRTGISEASTAARSLVWEANADVILCLRWTSVLDGRTTPICQSRDGHVRPATDEGSIPDEVTDPRLDPPSARPPAHINCRSILVAVIDAAGIVGNRPYVADDRVRERREAQFRQEAKKRGVPIQQVRKEWAQERVGQVPAKVTYEEWFSKQTVAFQQGVLGPARFKLYRQGMKLGAFVDNSGRRLTIQELREMG